MPPKQGSKNLDSQKSGQQGDGDDYDKNLPYQVSATTQGSKTSYTLEELESFVEHPVKSIGHGLEKFVEWPEREFEKVAGHQSHPKKEQEKQEEKKKEQDKKSGGQQGGSADEDDYGSGDTGGGFTGGFMAKKQEKATYKDDKDEFDYAKPSYGQKGKNKK